MTNELSTHYLQDALKVFRNYKKLGDGAIRQLADEELFRALDPEMNSVALNVKHMAGNMRSRWTDFLTTDGEKPDRDRDSEFVLGEGTTREDVLRWWEEGWRVVFSAVEPLRGEDLSREVTIRGEPHTVLMAINRQLAHYAYHTGQIVFLAKHFKSEAWQSLSIPRNRSAQFNRSMAERETK
ncbi:MAG TPA: DUF1572 family protein [Pyrinomonadaceae bacterium]|jgi:hypothetical protein|nr:DUF1572 family protein [Pyrinomonadaceae bacterium]